MIPMTSSSTLISLVLLQLASSAAWGMAHGHGGSRTSTCNCKETSTGPNATGFDAVPSRLGGNTTFGIVQLLDNELRDGTNPSNSSLLGRFQGIVAFTGLVTPPGMQSVISFVYTSGEYNGSMLFMVSTIVSFEHPFERAIMGGTGAFRMACRYCVIDYVWNLTPVSTVCEANLYMEMDD